MKRRPATYLVRPSHGGGHISTNCGARMNVPTLPFCSIPLSEGDGWQLTTNRPSRVCAECEREREVVNARLRAKS